MHENCQSLKTFEYFVTVTNYAVSIVISLGKWILNRIIIWLIKRLDFTSKTSETRTLTVFLGLISSLNGILLVMVTSGIFDLNSEWY